MLDVLIVGASRGIGLGLARSFLQRGDRVYAMIRGQAAPALEALAEEYESSLKVIACDMTRDDASQVLLSAIDGRLDVALFNAGVSAGGSLEVINQSEIGALFLTNAIAPLRIARQLSPRMTEGSVIAFMSSQMGSVALARAADMPLYGASKAALNSLVRSWSMAEDRPEACLLALHPGWVKTDMGGDNAPLSVAESVAGLTQVILDHRGRSGCHFLDHAQQGLPW